MIKIRNRRVALLLVLAMLATMFVGVGTASAAPEYVEISSNYTYVEADDAVTPGTITLAAGEDWVTPETIYAEVTLPDGVDLTDGGDTSFTVHDTSLSALQARINGRLVGTGKGIDIDSDFTGSVTAAVEVWGINSGGAIVFDVTDNVIIAKVSSGDVSVTAKKAKTIKVGSNKKGAKITVKELSPGALELGNKINLTIKGSKVEWDGVIAPTGDDLLSAGTISSNDKTLTYEVDAISSGYKGSITFEPNFKVQPGASGDVVVKVSGDDIDSTELTVATVGEGAIDITVDKADKDTVYLGQTATLDDVEINLDPSVKLDEDNYITVTLPDGLKWASEDDWNYTDYMKEGTADDQDSVVDLSDSKVKVDGLYDSDQSLWLSIDDNDFDNDFDITDLKIVADADAAVGDLEITFGGDADGTYTIGKVAAPFTVTADPISIAANGNDVAGGKITITEVDDGALIETNDNDDDKDDGTPEYFDITLPLGMTFADTPDVDVTDGDLDIGDVSLSDNEDVLQIEIKDASNVTSTIEITNVTYDIDNRASAGDVTAKVGKAYNLVGSNPLATVKVGTITGSSAIGTASFVIGSTTYTLNGVEKTMDVAPYAKNNRTYMPVRYVAYAMGIDDANILWDQGTQTVTLVKGAKIVQLTIGSNIIKINGAAVTMDVAPEAVSNRTMLPAAWVAQAFGATATWDAATNGVTIK